MKLRNKFCGILLIEIGALVLFFFFLVPLTYCKVLNVSLLLLYIVNTFFYFKYSKFDTYLDFEPIFIIISTIMVYIFPVFVYNGDNTAYLFSFGLPYSLETINKGTIISTVALFSFFCGSLNCEKKVRAVASVKYIPNNIILLFSLACYFVFALLGGFDAIKNAYKGGGSLGAEKYIMPFLIASIHVIIFNAFWNYVYFKRKNIIPLAYSLIVAIQFMLSGNRTVALYILMPIIILYSLKFRKVSVWSFFSFILVSLVLMNYIQYFRSGYSFDADLDWFYRVSDLLIPNTNTYLALEYVDCYGISFGISSLASILLLIPFSQSYIVNTFDFPVKMLNSAYIFSDYLGTSVMGIGMGTNFIASSYLAFGMIGVVCGPYLFGYVIKLLKNDLFSNYYKSIIYVVICGFSVYVVRSGILYMLSFIFYALIIASLNYGYYKYRK